MHTFMWAGCGCLWRQHRTRTPSAFSQVRSASRCSPHPRMDQNRFITTSSSFWQKPSPYSYSPYSNCIAHRFWTKSEQLETFTTYDKNRFFPTINVFRQNQAHILTQHIRIVSYTDFSPNPSNLEKLTTYDKNRFLPHQKTFSAKSKPVFVLSVFDLYRTPTLAQIQTTLKIDHL